MFPLIQLGWRSPMVRHITSCCPQMTWSNWRQGLMTLMTLARLWRGYHFPQQPTSITPPESLVKYWIKVHGVFLGFTNQSSKKRHFFLGFVRFVSVVDHVVDHGLRCFVSLTFYTLYNLGAMQLQVWMGTIPRWLTKEFLTSCEYWECTPTFKGRSNLL